MIKELQLLGLNKNEARIYEALIQHGPCRAGVLIKKLDVHRNIVYQSLEKLVSGGSATKVSKSNVWEFQITDPQILLSKIKSRESIVTEIIKEVSARKNKTDQQIVVYEGLESYRQYWVSSLERVPAGTIDYAVGVPSNKDWIEMMGTSYEHYLKLRIKKRIIWKTIHFSISESERTMLRELPEITEYRLWERPVNLLGNFNIIHDTVILTVVTDPPRIIEIKDPELVKVFQNYFDMMWEKAEEVI